MDNSPLPDFVFTMPHDTLCVRIRTQDNSTDVTDLTNPAEPMMYKLNPGVSGPELPLHVLAALVDARTALTECLKTQHAADARGPQ